jgi:small-conductance mechanosensitive channel
MGDLSTVIVPNSELIAKTVRNLTHANPLGLVQIKLPMPLDADAEQVRELLLAAFDAHADVLGTPVPGVSLDGIDANNLVFNATGYVPSPRMTYGVRSALLFDVLKRLHEAGITMLKAPTLLITTPVVARPAAASSANTTQ